MKMLELGQAVFLKTINNEARGGSRIIDTKIVTINKKYFYVDKLPRNKFRLSDLKEETQYCQNYEVYLDKQELLDESEGIRLYNKIRVFFQNFAYDTKNLQVSLDQLRKIEEILKKEEIVEIQK